MEQILTRQEFFIKETPSFPKNRGRGCLSSIKTDFDTSAGHKGYGFRHLLSPVN
mgnify:FL=1